MSGEKWKWHLKAESCFHQVRDDKSDLKGGSLSVYSSFTSTMRWKCCGFKFVVSHQMPHWQSRHHLDSTTVIMIMKLGLPLTISQEPTIALKPSCRTTRPVAQTSSSLLDFYHIERGYWRAGWTATSIHEGGRSRPYPILESSSMGARISATVLPLHPDREAFCLTPTGLWCQVRPPSCDRRPWPRRRVWRGDWIRMRCKIWWFYCLLISCRPEL